MGASPKGSGHSMRTRVALLTVKEQPLKANRPTGTGASGLVSSTTSPWLAYAKPALYTNPVWLLVTRPP